MKLRFNSFDVLCGVTELQTLVGSRVNQIYDIDNKTFLIRLQISGEAKQMLLMESGIRFHTTSFEWPKNMAPSGFSMKLRKHLKNKRLEKIEQLGVDRIVDFQFGTGEAAYHVILELYDRGNIILTDYTMTILYILRPHCEGEDVRFAVREKYPSQRAKKDLPLPNENDLIEAITSAKPGDSLSRVMMPMVSCGPTVIEHILRRHKLNNCIVSRNCILEKPFEQPTEEENRKKNSKRAKNKHDPKNTRDFDIKKDINDLNLAIQDLSDIIEEAKRTISKGFIIQKKEEKPSSDDGKEIGHYYQNIEYHSYNFIQFEEQPTLQLETFMMAVDEFYSSLESQKIDMKTLQQEREAFKKLSNVKKDHAKRIDDLNKLQDDDKQKAELITMNQGLVDNCILAVQTAIANQMSWPDIRELVKTAQESGDLVAGAIKHLKLEINHIALLLSDPYNSNDDGKNSSKLESKSKPPMIVDVDLSLSAWANARKYYDQKRSAAQKEQKTINASQKALKSAERKTQQTLKDVRTISVISKARKVYWFEKFYWFISSENYLVIGGRDAQQNELIVKRYMRPSDIYVHAEIQGASSVVIRNPSEIDVPPKTLLEAGTMAISYSVAWDAKVITNAYWVRSDQVSKTAPTGEYLGTGSFMIRGKKNFLPSCHLIMGLSLLFKLEDGCIENHRGERRVRNFEEEEKIRNEIEPIMSLRNVDISDTLDEKNQTKETNEHKIEEKKLHQTENEVDSEFPDTQVKVKHDTCPISGTSQSSLNHFLKRSEAKETDENKSASEEQESTIIAAAQPRKKQQHNKKKLKEETKSQKLLNRALEMSQSISNCTNENNSQIIKRGQKGKLKKIKAKYRDQDEEERQLRMQILKSGGKAENKIITDSKENKEYSVVENKFPICEPSTKQHVYMDETDDVLTGADVEMIDSLTGEPHEEDELLFVIPVVAPYQTLQNYKFKVKLTPGTGKRGRAAKTALAIFAKDKMCTSREKDLLKSVKEEALARNIPGKVKLAAPQLQKLKK